MLSCVIFLCAVVLLVTHAQTHLTVALIGVAITILTLICFAKDAKEIIFPHPTVSEIIREVIWEFPD